MRESIIIKSFIQSRDFFERHRSRFPRDAFGVGAQEVFNEISRYYEVDPSASSINIDILTERVTERYPNNKELIETFLETLPDDVSDRNVSQLLREKEQETLAYEILSLVGNNQYQQASEVMENFLALNSQVDGQEEDQLYHMTSIHDLLGTLSRENLIPIAPTVLTNYLEGGLPRQSQMGVFARPDGGKSAFCINLAVRLCEQGYKVLYFGNEDADSAMLLRVLCRFARVPKDELFTDPDGYMEKAVNNGYENFMFKSLSPGTLHEVAHEVNVNRPDVMVVDQLRNMSIGGKEDGLTQVLLKGAAACRNLAKKYNMLSVLVTQAGDEAHNKKVLDMTDVEYSNTGFAAALDLLIGIGHDDMLRSQSAAILSFPKNKRKPINPFRIQINHETSTIGVTK